MEVPDFKLMREYFDHIPKRRDRVLIKTLYLGALRVSELVTHVNPCDLANNLTQAYGRYLTWELADIQVDRQHTEKALLLKAATAKRRLRTKHQKEQGFIPKVIALPVMPNYEPFTEELLRWIQRHGTLSFPLTRRSVHRIVKENLRELDPKVSPHSLRHYRITHLVEKYQFQPPDLTAYAGWSVTHSFAAVGIPANPMLNIYYHSAWQAYFPKLLKPIKDLL
jgi:integrase